MVEDGVGHHPLKQLLAGLAAGRRGSDGIIPLQTHPPPTPQGVIPLSHQQPPAMDRGAPLPPRRLLQRCQGHSVAVRSGRQQVKWSRQRGEPDVDLPRPRSHGLIPGTPRLWPGPGESVGLLQIVSTPRVVLAMGASLDRGGCPP